MSCAYLLDSCIVLCATPAVSSFFNLLKFLLIFAYPVRKEPCPFVFLLQTLHKLNSLEIEELKKFKNVGSAKAERLIAYRQERGEIKTFEELSAIDGFTQSIIQSIKAEGLVKRKSQSYNYILDSATAKVRTLNPKLWRTSKNEIFIQQSLPTQWHYLLIKLQEIKSLSAIGIGQNEVHWCLLSRNYQVIDWTSNALKMNKRYNPKEFISQVGFHLFVRVCCCSYFS